MGDTFEDGLEEQWGNWTFLKEFFLLYNYNDVEPVVLAISKALDSISNAISSKNPRNTHRDSSKQFPLLAFTYRQKSYQTEEDDLHH